MVEKIQIGGHSFVLLYSQREIENRIYEMANSFKQDPTRDYVMIPVMTGAFYFSSYFLSCLDFPYRLFTMSVQSYQGLESRGEVLVHFPKDTTWIHDADVVILEDIIETGLTVHHLEKYFYARGARSVSVITLFHKPSQQRYEFDVLMSGFEISNEFIVGYGLDYDESGRWLKSVYQKLD